MAIVMIDNEVTEAAHALIEIGCAVTGTLHDGTPFDAKCVAKTPYAIQLKTETGGISVPISWTDIYKQEFERMRMQVPAGQLAAAPRRGRPKKEAGNAAPVEHPVQQPQAQPVAPVQPQGHGYQPTGSGGPTGHPPHQGTGGKPPQMPTIGDRLKGGEFDNFPTVQPLTEQSDGTWKIPAPPRLVTINKAEDDPEWPRSAIDDIVNDFREKLTILVDGLEQEAEDDARDNVELPPVKKTCADCVNVDMGKGICAKFSVAPPISVVVNAQSMCPDFMAIDEEIPF